MGPNDSMAKQVRLSGFTLVLPEHESTHTVQADYGRETKDFYIYAQVVDRREGGLSTDSSEFIGNPAPLYVRVAIDPVTDKPIIETGPMRGDEDTWIPVSVSVPR